MTRDRAAGSLVLLLVAGTGAGGAGAAGAQRLDSSLVRDRFAYASEARLDSLYGPLVYVMESEERGVYAALPLGAKRDYLRRFWSRRDPTPGTPVNETADAFYVRVGEANRRFREGGSTAVAGWRTDRGRIYIALGPPDETLARPTPPGTLPYEVWKYRGKQLKYCFVDLTRFGNYVLVWTNDRRERSQPNWRQLLRRDAYEDVMRF